MSRGPFPDGQCCWFTMVQPSPPRLDPLHPFTISSPTRQHVRPVSSRNISHQLVSQYSPRTLPHPSRACLGWGETLGSCKRHPKINELSAAAVGLQPGGSACRVAWKELQREGSCEDSGSCAGGAGFALKASHSSRISLGWDWLFFPPMQCHLLLSLADGRCFQPWNGTVLSPHPCTSTFGALCSRRDLGHLPPHPEQGAALHLGFAAGAQAVSGGQAHVGSADRQPVGWALPVWGWDTPAASLGHPGSQLLLL